MTLRFVFWRVVHGRRVVHGMGGRLVMGYLEICEKNATNDLIPGKSSLIINLVVKMVLSNYP